MRIVRTKFLAILHHIDAADADGLHQFLCGIAHCSIDRSGAARQRSVAQRRERGGRGGVERHHGFEVGAFLDDAEIEPPRLACPLGGFSRVEFLQRDIEYARQLRQRLQHLLRSGRVGVVDVHDSNVRDVEALRFVIEFRIEQLFAQHTLRGQVQRVVDFFRQRIDQAEGADMRPEARRRQRAVIDLGVGGESNHGCCCCDGNRRKTMGQFLDHAQSPVIC